MEEPRPRVEPGKPEAGWPTTAVGFQRQQRKAKRVVTVIALTLIVGPVAFVLLGFLISALGSGSGWALLGLPFMMLGALISVSLPFLAAGLFVYVAWSFIRQHYRKPATATPAALPDEPPDPAAPSPLAAEIALLETLRRDLAAQSRRRVALFVPLGLGVAGLLFYMMARGSRSSSDSPVLAFILFMTIGGAGAWFYAVSGPGARYTAAFKSQLLPRLIAAYGDLTHSIGTKPDLGPAFAAGFLPRCDVVEADDGFAGLYRGRTIRITELSAKQKRQGDSDDETVFEGLYVEIAVSTPFRGITILQDRDSRQSPAGLQRLHLEDPVFADIYTAWASDQIEGRAVLTPAVMERLLVMADGHSFLPPRFLLQGDRMVFALPTITPGSLFEPPRLETHVAAQQLASLEADLATVFALADAMIDMHIAVRAPREAAAGPATRTTTP